MDVEDPLVAPELLHHERRVPRVVVEITIMAVAASGLGPTAMDEMETPAAPSAVPTIPITPGRSSLRTTIMCADGGTSTRWSSTTTIRGSVRRPTVISVPATECVPERRVMSDL